MREAGRLTTRTVVYYFYQLSSYLLDIVVPNRPCSTCIKKKDQFLSSSITLFRLGRRVRILVGLRVGLVLGSMDGGVGDADGTVLAFNLLPFDFLELLAPWPIWPTSCIPELFQKERIADSWDDPYNIWATTIRTARLRPSFYPSLTDLRLTLALTHWLDANSANKVVTTFFAVWFVK